MAENEFDAQSKIGRIVLKEVHLNTFYVALTTWNHLMKMQGYIMQP